MPAQSSASADRQFPVTERQGQCAADLRHPSQQRAAPGGRQHIQIALRAVLFQFNEQGLSYHHIANPGWTDDQQPAGGTRHSAPSLVPGGLLKRRIGCKQLVPFLLHKLTVFRKLVRGYYAWLLLQ